MNRTRMPPTRPSVNRKIIIGGYEMYLIVGFHPDTNQPGELFLTLSKAGSALSGLAGSGIALVVSMALQHGVPWSVIADKWRHTRFEPNNHEYTSILDALAIEITKIIVEYGGDPDQPITLNPTE